MPLKTILKYAPIKGVKKPAKNVLKPAWIACKNVNQCRRPTARAKVHVMAKFAGPAAMRAVDVPMHALTA